MAADHSRPIPLDSNSSTASCTDRESKENPLSRLISARHSVFARPYCIQRIRSLLERLQKLEETKTEHAAWGWDVADQERAIQEHLKQLAEFGIIARSTLEAFEQADSILVDLKVAELREKEADEEILRKSAPQLPKVAPPKVKSHPKRRRKPTTEEWRQRRVRRFEVQADDEKAMLDARLKKRQEIIEVLKRHALSDDERERLESEIDSVVFAKDDENHEPVKQRRQRRDPGRW